MNNIEILPDADQLAKTAVKHFIHIAQQSIENHGLFSVVLSGGSTPQSLYSLLASEPYSEQVDWSRTHFFWGDERCVPPDHTDSNYFKAWTSFLSHIPVPQENIHRIPAEIKPELAAEQYEEQMLQFFSALVTEEQRTHARFDLVLLGMGDDGHTASLFPGTPAVQEETRWVAAQYVDKLAAWRITLTPAILNRAANIIFLVSGEGKSWPLQKVIYGSYQPDRFPAQVIKPTGGSLLWLVDEPAASLF
jgi:6-phosphogluconolactonase